MTPQSDSPRAGRKDRHSNTSSPARELGTTRLLTRYEWVYGLAVVAGVVGAVLAVLGVWCFPAAWYLAPVAVAPLGILVFGDTDYAGTMTTCHYGAVAAREPRDEEVKASCRLLGRRLTECVAVVCRRAEGPAPAQQTRVADAAGLHCRDHFCCSRAAAKNLTTGATSVRP